jgi:hypothetical protein
MTGVVGITFALYSEQTGGAALWIETQNVTGDGNGHYSVLLGATKPDRLPAELFTSEQARWVGVQVAGQAEQPRVLLVSAPYALKAGDAETVGGLPPSAFVLAAPPVSGPTAASNSAASAAVSVSPPTGSDVTTTGGTVNAIPLFTTATNIQSSILTQTGTKQVNVVGELNLPATAAATKTAGANSRPLDFVASSFSSSTGKAVNQTFQWQAEPAANDTGSPSGTLNLLYGLGTSTPSETGLKLGSKGIFTFATGQTFPGTGDGTVTSVATGLGLAGGPITKTGTLTIDTTVVPQLAASNTFTGAQTVNGSLSATGVVTAGTSVGIGTTSPLAALEVASPGADEVFIGNANCGGDAGIAIGVSGFDTCANFSMVGDGSNTFIGAPTGDILFRTINNTSTPMTIYSCCQVEIDTDLTVSGPNVTGPVLSVFGGTAGSCVIDTGGSLSCTGSKNAVVPVDSGKRIVAMSAIEAPENWFEDAGEAAMVNGAAVVRLDSTYTQTVNTDMKYQVFLTPYGDCKGLYVTNRTANSFEVHELGGGTASLSFGYRIMALRKKYENVRFSDHTHDLDGHKRMLARTHAAGATPVGLRMPAAVATPAGAQKAATLPGTRPRN